MRILERVPGSVLWLLGHAEPVRDNLRREAAARGIEPARLVFAARRPYADYLSAFGLADLYLDTVPFNAGTTASDVLWAGLPLLTCSGRAFAARMAGSLLRSAGLPELITHDLAGYEVRAVELALQPARLETLRRRLQVNRLSRPLFDTARFCRHLEAAYAHMWERHRAGAGPAGFAVPQAQSRV
jgi:predicted O-linked N-acetylglucosamine transferase (SPINDLY family)